jgi:hypothetical protein
MFSPSSPAAVAANGPGMVKCLFLAGKVSVRQCPCVNCTLQREVFAFGEILQSAIPSHELPDTLDMAQRVLIGPR